MPSNEGLIAHLCGAIGVLFILAARSRSACRLIAKSHQSWHTVKPEDRDMLVNTVMGLLLVPGIALLGIEACFLLLMLIRWLGV